jgi:hypothetical protein
MVVALREHHLAMKYFILAREMHVAIGALRIAAKSPKRVAWCMGGLVAQSLALRLRGPLRGTEGNAI